MNVLVYPEIRCKFEDGRWKLLPPFQEAPPFTVLKAGPIPLPERLIPQIPQQDGVFEIPGALWKRADGYFKGSNRYDPSTITGCDGDNYKEDNKDFSVDSQDTGTRGPDKLKIYCSPYDAPHWDPLHPDNPCVVPAHGSDKIELIELRLVSSS